MTPERITRLRSFGREVPQFLEVLDEIVRLQTELAKFHTLDPNRCDRCSCGEEIPCSTCAGSFLVADEDGNERDCPCVMDLVHNQALHAEHVRAVVEGPKQ